MSYYIDGEYVYGPDIYLDDYYMDEKWWYIENAPGYMISDKGRVWSERSQIFLKPKPMDREGHLGVCLFVNGRPRYEYIHRLMAKAFIPNPNNYPIVRHLNDNREDNDIDNLAWGTQRDNQHDSVRNGTAYIPTDEDRFEGNRDRMCPVIATDNTTGEEFHFESQGRAAYILGIPQANIWKVVNGERRSAGGYSFRRDYND